MIIETEKILISVIIPIYNVERYLEECLDSIIKQTLSNIEIICINDGSTDNCLKILKKYAEKEKRIIIIDQKNQGSGIARNNGIDIAKGEYIAFMDPDDYYDNETILFNLYENAVKNNVDLSGGNFSLVCDIVDEYCLDIKKEEKEYKESTVFDFNESRVGAIDDYRVYSSWFWRFIYKNDFLKNNNIRFPSYKRFQDIPFLAKSLSLCNNIYFLNQNMYCYRINHKAIKYSKEQQTHILLSLNECFEIYYKYKKYQQYSDIFNVFIEMIDVFSEYIENDEIELVNKIYKKLNLTIFDYSLFPKKNIKNLKNIISIKDYNNLVNMGKYYED